MSDSLAQPTKHVLVKSLAKSLPILIVGFVLIAGWWAVHAINVGGRSPDEETATDDGAAIVDTVTLSHEKLEAGKIESVPAQLTPLQPVLMVPGRIQYDASKHVDVKAPLDGILAELLVTPGQRVEQGQLLALLESPEIGQARAAIVKSQEQQEIVNRLLERHVTLVNNLSVLTTMLDQRQPMPIIESALSGQSLGSYRLDLLSAYSRLLLTTELLEKAQPLAASGSIPGRIVRQREAERQIAEAAFRTARDQAMFAATQAKLQAEAAAAEAERQCNLAWQAVDSLLGYEHPQRSVNWGDAKSLTRLEIRAPLTASVESLGFASRERVASGQSLIVLANTESLYVAASIREGNWSAVSLRSGTPITVAVPALDGRQYVASVHFVGREVAADTNAVPLVANIENADGLLRPGMLVRVEMPKGERRNALAVKAESVIQHDNQQFVFVDRSGGTFQRVDVSTGISTEEWIEVTQGLEAGQPVVTHGEFLLKSELLLQGEYQ